MKLRKFAQVFVIVMHVFGLLAGCAPDQYEPTDGVWFCEDLQMQLSYEKEEQSYFIENGDKIICACGSDKGVPYLFVSCQELDHPIYDLGEEIFRAKIIGLSSTEFVVYDEQADLQYTFLLID